MKRNVTRAVGIAAAATIALGVGTAQPAAADDGSARDAGSWLKGQRNDAGLLPGQFGGNDVGMTIDLALGLVAADQSPRAVITIGDALADAVAGYTASYEYSFGGDDYAGTPSNARGKALVGAQATGQDPADIGGDLVQRLEDVTTDDGALAGALSDSPTKNGEPDPANDFANVIGQSFAARGLTDAGSDEAGAARRFLLTQQCDDGSFVFDVTTPTDVDTACAEDDASVDGVSIALLNLMAIRGKKAAVAVEEGIGWLRGQQRKNGSFAGAAPTSSPNANTTGLAGWALGEAGANARAKKAAAWVAKVQLVNGRGCRAFDAEDLGAIAYDPAARDAAQENGIVDGSEGTADQFRRTTSQAFPVLQWAPAARPTGVC